MSMSYELMMRKKTQIMYATIKGTLTENDSVFSGFSQTNYLTLQNQFALTSTTKAEFCFKINVSDISSVNAILGTPNSYGINFVITSSGKLQLYVGDGNSWTIVNYYLGTTTLSTNTDYWVKLIFDNSRILVLLSTDGTIYTTEINQIATISGTYTYDLAIGRARTGAQYLYGSIDLPKSYVKLEATKYNLQAVVGYTVVGSPTINDGVVSGFDATNYIKSTKNFNTSNLPVIQKIEQQVKVIIGESTAPQQINGITYNIGFDIYTTKFRLKMPNNIKLESSVSAIANTTFWLKMIYNDVEKIVSIMVSTDKINWVTNTLQLAQDYSIGSINSSLQYGNNGYGRFYGSIDFNNNETYLEVNNKLWFNGYPA